MSEPFPIKIAFRIPGQWSHPRELIEKLPEGFRLTPDDLILPDGTVIEFGAARADNQFAEIFRSSCRREPTDEEMAKVDGYKVNVFLKGPGGSLEAARKMMRAAEAILHAGGAGVFIDNSTVAHGGQSWLELTEDGSPDALSFAFVGITAGKTEVWTLGMHVLGFRDILMKRVDADQFDIIEVICYVCRSEDPIHTGHIVADENGPRFQAFVEESPEELAGSPLHNPFGRLKLVSLRDIAETN